MIKYLELKGERQRHVGEHIHFVNSGIEEGKREFFLGEKHIFVLTFLRDSTLVPIFFFHRFYSISWKMHLVLVLSISALTAKSYVADGTIKIIIKFFILALKNAMSASKLKKKKT